MHIFLFIYAVAACAKKQKTFTQTPLLSLTGSFVWGDALIFSPFWAFVSLSALYTKDWLFFWVTVSVFWVVRSSGEVLYWFLEQFSGHPRNKPANLLGYNWVKSDAVFFLYQIFWQCITVISIVTSCVLLYQWLPRFMAH
ncbi:hypothetical protein KA078_00805 [Candidatus Woesebacteria bacterium]|nr:hypothetical protein [Candidatus Woesebacteria bacterium]